MGTKGMKGGLEFENWLVAEQKGMGGYSCYGVVVKQHQSFNPCVRVKRFSRHLHVRAKDFSDAVENLVGCW